MHLKSQKAKIDGVNIIFSFIAFFNKYQKILDKIIHKHYTENSNGKYAIIKVQYIFCI